MRSTVKLLITAPSFVIKLNKISIEKAAVLNESVQGGQWYWANSLSKASLPLL